ncbi:MAG: sulfatase [Deltaproteobacteria bacterium]|nr:sulfatase [Deltaproteobacteria bacterium]
MAGKKLTRREFVKKVAAGGLTLSAGSILYSCSKKLHPDVIQNERELIANLSGYSGTPPNIIIINADDLGYGDLGCYGSQAIRTPNINLMAEKGVRFTDFHACDSVCTPSRAGLLTGRYPKRMNLDMPLLAENTPIGKSMMIKFGFLAGKMGLLDIATEGGATGIAQHEITLAEALKMKNYQTGMVGKWHLGDYSGSPEHNPVKHGFDFYFGVPHSNDIHPFPLYRNEEKLEPEVKDQTKLTGLYTKEAVDFIKTSKDKPFFLYFAHTFPHRPLFASENFKDKSEAGVFGDVVEEIDWSVGEIMKTLKELNLESNTLVIFTSDNGPWYQGSPGEFRGRKGQSYEGGHRVPFIACREGHIPAGSVCKEPAMNIDLFPTCLAMAGLTIPGDRIIDGRNIENLLVSQSMDNPHDYFFFYHHGELEGVRAGNWKYIRSINHYSWPMPVNKKLGSLTSYTNGPLPMLFNLENDPGEAYNVINKYPDKAKGLASVMTWWDGEMAANPGGWLTLMD